ncbi:hypothetical protein HDV06_001469 [Boothiomyces sp. JEL0866]|nr:hypothetical protein HDV06_001469 [Boothiomyces sp. JEL0866]
MNSIAESFEKVSKKQRLLAIETDSCLDAMIANLNSCQDNPQAVAQLLSNTKAMASKLTESAKDFHNTIGKYSKAIEKKFKTDLDGIWDPKALDGKEYVVYQILVMHFVREGRFDLAKLFAREAGIEFEESLHAQFEGMFHIQEALRNEDISLALEWALVHRKSLVESGSTFEFNLHKLKYLGYIRKGEIKSALAYARQNFSQFAIKHIKDIQQLMCSILYHKRLPNSPYPQFADNHLWSDIQSQFSRDFCNVLGQSCESPLFTCVTVGSTALPMIMKISSLMKDKAVEWSQSGELPVTIPLLDKQKYHSVFVCPVTKEQGTETNPPMMMVCGHVISSESLTRLSKGSLNSRFKCPYCPVDSTAAQAVRVFF